MQQNHSVANEQDGHEIDLLKDMKRNRYQVNIGNRKELLNLNEPIFQLQQPTKTFFTNDKSCISCNAKKPTKMCQFCGHRACEKCCYKQRPFQSNKMGTVCKVCDKKFFLLGSFTEFALELEQLEIQTERVQTELSCQQEQLKSIVEQHESINENIKIAQQKQNEVSTYANQQSQQMQKQQLELELENQEILQKIDLLRIQTQEMNQQLQQNDLKLYELQHINDLEKTKLKVIETDRQTYHSELSRTFKETVVLDSFQIVEDSKEDESVIDLKDQREIIDLPYSEQRDSVVEIPRRKKKSKQQKSKKQIRKTENVAGGACCKTGCVVF